MSLSVEFKGTKGRFASLNAEEVISHVKQRFAEGLKAWTINSRLLDKSHTKAAAKVGGGCQYWITLRQQSPVTLRNGDIVYPQITLRDRTYAGASLQVTFGLFRQVCSNGLMAFRKVVEPVSIPHFKNRADILMRLDTIIESSAAQLAAVLAEADNLIVTPLNTNPLHVITQLELPPSLVKKLTEVLTNNLQRSEDDVSTVFGLYNLINEVDRRKARKNSTAYLDRDTRLVERIQEVIRVAA
jgi:hypothetical protein